MINARRLAAAAVLTAAVALPAAALAAPQWRLSATDDEMADLTDQASIKTVSGWKAATIMRVQKQPILQGSTHVLFVEYFDCKGWRVGIKQIDAYNGATPVANVTKTDAEVEWKPIQKGTFVDGDAGAVCNNSWADDTVLSQDHSVIGEYLFKKLNE